MNEDDIIPIGKLSRSGKPRAAVSFDPTYGIRIVGADSPADPAAAARWCRRAGWLRVCGTAKGSPSSAVKDFLKEWGRGTCKSAPRPQ